jgi:hypothetical protein
MASRSCQPESPISSEPPRVRLEPIRFPDPLLDASGWPHSSDLRVELRVLLPALDHVRGPVTRLLLGVGNWTARPGRVTTDGRTVSIGYSAGQSATMIKVFCADGGAFTIHLAPPGPAPRVPHPPDDQRAEEAWEAEGGGLGLLRSRAVR